MFFCVTNCLLQKKAAVLRQTSMITTNIMLAVITSLIIRIPEISIEKSHHYSHKLRATLSFTYHKNMGVDTAMRIFLLSGGH